MEGGRWRASCLRLLSWLQRKKQEQKTLNGEGRGEGEMKREWRGEGGELLVYACLAGFKDHERKLLF